MFELKGEGTEAFISFLKEWLDSDRYIYSYTSGSTGKPKKIGLLKSDMAESATSTISFFNLDDTSLLFCPLSPDYIAGKMMLVRAIMADCALLSPMPSNKPFEYMESSSPIDLAAIVPSQVNNLIDNASCVPPIKNLIIGGAPLSPTMERKLLEKGFNGYVTYGMTETASHVALRGFGDKYYTALTGIKFSTDSDDRLIIQASHRTFKSLQTNDVVRLISESSFEWLGRYDNVINSGGIKIHPEEVEKKLKGVIEVAFFVAGEPCEKWGTQVVLIMEESEKSNHVLIQEFHKVLSPFQIPKKIYRLPMMPMTSNGKIDRPAALSMLSIL